MLYYGGSTFGWNGANDYTSKSSYDYDPNVEVLVYYTDFYGYNSYNIPAAWKYGDNILLTSVHPEANNCTNQQDSDCPPAGTLSQLDIDRNRAWLANYINEVAETNFIVPDVEVEPSFNTTAPHDRYPTNLCYSNSNSNSESILFCDGFDTEEGKVPVGLSPQFQRNQTSYEKVFPWNTSYISYWYDNYYTSAYNGNGYAINVPQSSTLNTAAITTKPFHTRLCNSVSISYATIGSYTSLGYFKVEYSVDSTDDWQTLAIHNYATTTSKEWEHFSYNVQTIGNNNGLIRFTCAAGQYIYNFCALDSLYVLCNN